MKAAMRRRNVVEKSLCLILSIGFFALIYGCDEEPEPKVDLSLPKVMSTVPAAGGTQSGNAAIIFTLNKPLAEAQVKGAAGAISIAGKVVTFTPSPTLPGGSVTLTLTGTDESGQELEEFTLQFTALMHHCLGPEIDGAECKPKDGEVNVDPDEYPEKLVIAFTEDLSDVRVVSIKPEFTFTDAVGEDGRTLEISFVNYTMPYETEFVIGLRSTDLAGNSEDVEYSFTTMVKR